MLWILVVVFFLTMPLFEWGIGVTTTNIHDFYSFSAFISNLYEFLNTVLTVNDDYLRWNSVVGIRVETGSLFKILNSGIR